MQTLPVFNVWNWQLATCSLLVLDPSGAWRVSEHTILSPRRGGGHGWTPPLAVRVRAADDGQVVPRSFSAAASRKSPGWWRRPASTPRSTTPACCCPCTPSASPSKARWSTSRPTGCGNESCPPTSRRPASPSTMWCLSSTRGKSKRYRPLLYCPL